MLGHHLLASFNHAFVTGSLTPDQRRGVISLIPKKGKDKRYIRNWRPISMLNVDYKILAKSLAARLANVIPQLVHPNQTGFIPSRHIGDTIKNIHSLIEFTRNSGRSGLIVSLDFSAAFDSLRHDYMLSALESFSLGPSFLKWIKILYSSSETCVLNRGQSSGWFPFKKGIRQGCPISPFLFVLAVEGLAEVIRSRQDIRGLHLLDSETKILQFADDSTIFAEDESSLLATLHTIEEFKSLSGLGLNLQKSQGLNIGDIPFTHPTSRSLPWGNRAKILGISFQLEQTEGEEWDLNFAPAIKKMEQVCNSWRFRNLSLKGRVVILNTLVLPIVYYPCVMLPVPPKAFKEIDRVMSLFLWRGKKAKISQRCLEEPTHRGGLGLHNIRNRVKASKMSWLKKLIIPPKEPWQFHFEFKSDLSGVEVAIQRSRPSRLIRSCPFFSEIFQYWKEISKEEPASDLAIRNELLWGNLFLKGKFKKKQEKQCRALGISKINDILKFGRILSREQFLSRYDSYPPQGFLQKCKDVIPETWLRLLSATDQNTPEGLLIIKNEKGDWVPFHIQSAKKLYALFQSKRTNRYTCSDRWLKAYQGDDAFAPGPHWKDWHLLPYLLSHEVQLQSFHFRIMYRVIPCRVYLAQIKIRDSDACVRCAEQDDLFHFFFECPCVKDFWDSLATWMGGMEGVRDFPDDLTEEEFLLGIVSRPGDFSLFNYILLCAKFYVYKVTVFQAGEPDLYQFLVDLKNRLEIERLICYADASFSKRFKRWLTFYQHL